jgi:hypothetical protein
MTATLPGARDLNRVRRVMAKQKTAGSLATTDHDTIREWAEARGGKPAHVKGTGKKDDPGILRIDFPGYTGANRLEEISWEEFFEKFDESDLALVYQEETAEGERSNFNKLVSKSSVSEQLE